MFPRGQPSAEFQDGAGWPHAIRSRQSFLGPRAPSPAPVGAPVAGRRSPPPPLATTPQLRADISREDAARGWHTQGTMEPGPPARSPVQLDGVQPAVPRVWAETLSDRDAERIRVGQKYLAGNRQWSPYSTSPARSPSPGRHDAGQAWGSHLGIVILATIKDVMRCRAEAGVLKGTLEARRAQVNSAYFDTDRIMQELGAQLEALPTREESARQQALRLAQSQAQLESECELWRKRACEVSSECLAARAQVAYVTRRSSAVRRGVLVLCAP